MLLQTDMRVRQIRGVAFFGRVQGAAQLSDAAENGAADYRRLAEAPGASCVFIGPLLAAVERYL